jgi:hypothetical protein
LAELRREERRVVVESRVEMKLLMERSWGLAELRQEERRVVDSRVELRIPMDQNWGPAEPRNGVRRVVAEPRVEMKLLIPTQLCSNRELLKRF